MFRPLAFVSKSFSPVVGRWLSASKAKSVKRVPGGEQQKSQKTRGVRLSAAELNENKRVEMAAEAEIASKTIRKTDFALPVSELVLPSISLATASQKEITSFKIGQAINRFKLHATDAGSAQVQIAVMTEKILNMARHMTMHKKDKHSNRGFQMLAARRKKMMSYLKRTNLEKFKSVIKALGLEREGQHVR